MLNLLLKTDTQKNKTKKTCVLTWSAWTGSHALPCPDNKEGRQEERQTECEQGRFNDCWFPTEQITGVKMFPVSTGNNTGSCQLLPRRHIMASKSFSSPWTDHRNNYKPPATASAPSFHVQLCKCFPAITQRLSLITTYHRHVYFSSAKFKPPPLTHRWLFFLTHHHVVVSVVRDGEEVRRNFVAFLPLVHLGHFGSVDGQPFVGVDGHTEEARVSLKRRGRKLIDPSSTAWCFQSHTGSLQVRMEHTLDSHSYLYLEST